jgi:micrococcal nuclease
MFRSRNMRVVIVLLALGIMPSLFNKFSPTKKIEFGYYKVLEVYDGDTILVDMDGVKEKVRMIGIDTPETHKPNTPVQCYGPEASDYSKKHLSNQKVRLDADPKSTPRDRYGRLLRYVYLSDGTFYNLSLVEQGYGFAYTAFPYTKLGQIIDAEKSARDNKLGLWGTCNPTKNGNSYKSNVL